MRPGDRVVAGPAVDHHLEVVRREEVQVDPVELAEPVDPELVGRAIAAGDPQRGRLGEHDLLAEPGPAVEQVDPVGAVHHDRVRRPVLAKVDERVGQAGPGEVVQGDRVSPAEEVERHLLHAGGVGQPVAVDEPQPAVAPRHLDGLVRAGADEPEQVGAALPLDAVVAAVEETSRTKDVVTVPARGGCRRCCRPSARRRRTRRTSPPKGAARSSRQAGSRRCRSSRTR